MNGNKIWYGGDYNPEQWPEETWQGDLDLLKGAGIDTLTLNVFSWASLQPSEETYDFARLDRIMDLVRKNGFRVILATSTGAHPAWMAKRHPDILRTEFNGMRRKFGGRHNSCPNSPSYRLYAPRLAGELARRYGGYENLAAWHISNEFGGTCYCENCEQAFRAWLREKYGTLDALNRAWDTAFWGHTFYDWDEIVVPNLLSEYLDNERNMFQGIALDYKRFNSDSMLACFQMEYEAVKAFTPDIPVTTNLMGFYKELDYGKWGRFMDIVSWDNYPGNEDPPAKIAMAHDLMRGVGGGKPFLLMEQTPSVANWLPYNALKRPGVMRLWSYQAAAHGADSILFFQMKRSVGACEKLHGAVIDHVGNGNTRVYRETAALGEELKRLGGRTLGARTKADAALYFDWDNWWAIDGSAGPSKDLDYLEEFFLYYQALYEENIGVDVIGSQDSFSEYSLVIAPMLYMVKPGLDEKIRQFVSDGGCFAATCFSGMADENDLIVTGGYPGRLRDILGIWVEESDALPEGRENHFTYKGKRYPARLLCDLSHPEGAQALSAYEEDFYAGMPALTVNRFGAGQAFYMGACSGPEFYRDWLSDVCKQCGAAPALPPVEGVEVTERENENGTFLFVLNHNETPALQPLSAPCRDLLGGARYEAGDSAAIPAKGVMILERIV